MTASEDRPWSRRVAPEDEGAGGRATPLSPGGQSEPLHYQTVQRPPGSEGQFRPRRPAPERRDEPDLPPTEALPTQDVPRYRPRDFSPEGRRAVPSWAPTAGQTDVPLSERLDYHTLTRAEVRAATQRFGVTTPAGDASSADDAGGSPRDASDAPGGAHASGAGASSGGDGPMSTPEQPLTRRQLRALREAQEAERAGSGGGAAPTESPDQGAEERPTARPWAPVFYGEPVQTEEPVPTDEPAPAEEPGSTDQPVPSDEPLPSDEASAPEPPSWSGSAPATFAIPVIPDEPDVDSPASATPPQAPESTQQRSLDDWVAGLYRDQPAADGSPLELVEPPEPARWGSDAAVPRSEQASEATDQPADVPSVLDDLFAPPTAAPESSPEAAAPRPTDPLEFLDAAPSAADRVDLPAPSAWEAPPVVGQPPVEPPGTRAEEPAIDVEAEEVPPAEAGEVHPVVIDAEPLPAEPIAPGPGPVATPSGHWSAQAADDGHADVASGRDVGGGHGVVTTNALVLPSIPSPELSGPLTTTGEIVITGSIELPRSLSSTGAHPTQLDQSSLDHELDPGDQQIVSVDSQPVRAIKAVSTHTSTRGMMTSTKPHGNRGLTVLIIVTAGLAVVTLAVLAVGLVNNAF